MKNTQDTLIPWMASILANCCTRERDFINETAKRRFWQAMMRVHRELGNEQAIIDGAKWLMLHS